MVIAFHITHYIPTYVSISQILVTTYAIHVPGESFNDILRRFIVSDHTTPNKGGFLRLLQNQTKEAYKVDRDHILCPRAKHKYKHIYVITIDMTYLLCFCLVFLCHLSFDWYHIKKLSQRK